MPLTSDLTLDVKKFDSKSISKETENFNDGLIDIMKGGPKWWEVSCTDRLLNFANIELLQAQD